MGTYLFAEGVVADRWQLGAAGLLIKDSSGELNVRNAADSADADLQCAGLTATTMSGTAITASTSLLSPSLRAKTDNSSNYVAVQSPNSLAASYTLTLPANLTGSNGKVLGATDGSGTLGWVDLPEPGTASWLDSVKLSPTGNIAGTYNNGSSGVGATITAGSNGAIGNQDGFALQANDRILLKSQSDQKQNGIYEVTAVGDASNPYVLTRTNDADDENLDGASVFVRQGTTNGDAAYVCTNDSDITFGTDNIIFTKYLVGSITFAQIDGASVITNSEGILSNSTSDVTIPTTQAVYTETSKAQRVFKFQYNFTGTDNIANGGEKIAVGTLDIPQDAIVSSVVCEVTTQLGQSCELYVGMAQANGSGNATSNADSKFIVEAGAIELVGKSVFPSAGGAIFSASRKLQVAIKNLNGAATVTSGAATIFVFLNYVSAENVSAY